MSKYPSKYDFPTATKALVCCRQGMSPTETAKYIEVDPRTLRNWLDKGKADQEAGRTRGKLRNFYIEWCKAEIEAEKVLVDIVVSDAEGRFKTKKERFVFDANNNLQRREVVMEEHAPNPKSAQWLLSKRNPGKYGRADQQIDMFVASEQEKSILDVAIAQTNTIYKKYYFDDSRRLILYGGAGSGKSVFASQKVIMNSLSDELHNTLILRKVAATNRQSTFALIKRTVSDLGVGSRFKINKSEMLMTADTGNQIKFAGLDDVEKLKSITFESGDLTDVWIEEASEISYDDYQQVNLRLRGEGTKKQIVLSFNPISEHHWLKAHFFDGQDVSTNVKTTYKDNQFIDEEYKKELESLIDVDPVFHRIYALGEWGTLENIILSNWEKVHCPKDPGHYDEVLTGLDFGFNHASALLQIGYKDGHLFIFREFKRSQLTNPELMTELVRYKRQLMTADSAEPARIKAFKQEGFYIRAAEKGKDSVLAFIEYARSRKLFVDSSCIETIKELQTWKYKEDRAGNVFEEPVAETSKISFDLMAAFRYAVEKKAKNKVPGVKGGADGKRRHA